MPRESLFSNLSLAGKITLLVGLMGLVSMAIIGYAMVHMRQMDEQYRTLISLESELAQSFGRTGTLLGESQRMVHAAHSASQGTASPPAAEAAQRLRTLQREFETELNDIAQGMPHQGRELMGVRSRSQKVFDAGDQVLDAATKRDKEAATTALYQAFEPALLELKQDLDTFRNRSHGEFAAFMNEQNLATEKTLWRIAAAVAAALAGVLVLSAYVALTQISRPVSQLARIMQRLTEHQYDDVIPATNRRDEVGTMARALQVFKNTMEGADQLTAQAQRSEEARTFGCSCRARAPPSQ